MKREAEFAEHSLKLVVSEVNLNFEGLFEGLEALFQKTSILYEVA